MPQPDPAAVGRYHVIGWPTWAPGLSAAAQGVLFAMTSTFLTGQTLHIDGGEPLT